MKKSKDIARKNGELIEAICDNCRKAFKATFEQLDHTGFATIKESERGTGSTNRIYNFCSFVSTAIKKLKMLKIS